MHKIDMVFAGIIAAMAVLILAIYFHTQSNYEENLVRLKVIREEIERLKNGELK